MDKIFEMKLDAFGGVECFILGGVEYVRKEKPEPEPRTGYYIRVDGEFVLQICNQYRFREDLGFSRNPKIVGADGKVIGYVYIGRGEVSIE